MAATKDPTPLEIAAACLEIQAGWSSDERMKRLRPDLRPVVRTADDRLVGVSPDDYEGHHSEHRALQTMAGVNGSRLGGSI